MRFYLLLFLLFLLCCAKKEEPLQKTYVPPETEWPEDVDLDDLPEAGDTAENEDF